MKDETRSGYTQEDVIAVARRADAGGREWLSVQASTGKASAESAPCAVAISWRIRRPVAARSRSIRTSHHKYPHLTAEFGIHLALDEGAHPSQPACDIKAGG